METTIEINVDEVSFRNAEIFAKKQNKTISDLVTDYIHSLPNHKIEEKRTNEVSSYEELTEALQLAEDDFKEGRIVSEQDIITFLNQLQSNKNV